MPDLGIGETIAAVLTSAGVGAETAGAIAPVLTGALTGSAIGASGSALTGSNIGHGAGFGALTGGIGSGIGEGIGAIADAGGGGLSGFGNSVGGVFGDSTLGSDIAGGLSNFTDSSGLSQLFGGTAAPSGDLTSAYDAVNSAAPNLSATSGATAPVDFAPGGASASYTAGAASPGSAGVGGGTLTGFGNDPLSIGEPLSVGSTQGGGSLASDIGAGIGGTPSSPSIPFMSPSNAGAFNYDITGAPAGASSYSIPQQFANAAAPSVGGNVSGLSSLFSGKSASPINGLLNSGLGMLLNNPNSQGLNAISTAAQQAQANYAPYQKAGTAAENTLADLYGNNGTAAQTAAMQNFQNTPGYQFALNQGLNALNANNAATGQVLSGNAQEAINNYAQGTASQQYNNYINELNNLASGGMTAAGGAGTAGLTGAGAQAQIGQNRANAQNSAVGTGLNALFPTGQLDISQLLSGLKGGNNNGLLGLFG